VFILVVGGAIGSPLCIWTQLSEQTDHLLPILCCLKVLESVLRSLSKDTWFEFGLNVFLILQAQQQEQASKQALNDHQGDHMNPRNSP
jgi:hypothetical protein